MCIMVIQKHGCIKNCNMERFSRQTGLLAPEVAIDTRVIVIGCGGIGSWTALALAKMGIGHIELFDHDTVEEGNIPSQMFMFEDEGLYKTFALAEHLRKLSEANIVSRAVKWAGEVAPIIVCAVDSMDTRREIWDSVKDNKDVELFIDGRMGGEIVRVEYARLDDQASREAYEATLYTSEEAEPLRCGFRAIVYAGMIAGGLIAHGVRRHLADEEMPREALADLGSMGAVWSS